MTGGTSGPCPNPMDPMCGGAMMLCMNPCFFDNDCDGADGGYAGIQTGVFPNCSCPTGTVMTSPDSDDSDADVQ